MSGVHALSATKTIVGSTAVAPAVDHIGQHPSSNAHMGHPRLAATCDTSTPGSKLYKNAPLPILEARTAIALAI